VLLTLNLKIGTEPNHKTSQQSTMNQNRTAKQEYN